MFGAVKLTKNVDFDTHKYSVYVARFLVRSNISLPDGRGFSKKVIRFGAYMSSSVHIDNKKKDILILGKTLTNGLDNTSLTAEN